MQSATLQLCFPGADDQAEQWAVGEGLTSGLSATRCSYVCDELSVWPTSATTPSLRSMERLSEPVAIMPVQSFYHGSPSSMALQALK